MKCQVICLFSESHIKTGPFKKLFSVNIFIVIIIICTWVGVGKRLSAQVPIESRCTRFQAAGYSGSDKPSDLGAGN